MPRRARAAGGSPPYAVAQRRVERGEALPGRSGRPAGEDHVRGFYQACGWHPRPATSWALGFDPWDPAVRRAPVPVMVLPVTAGLGEWPSGDLHWHCPQV